jgi:two-component system sensor histidine kinase FlrB
MEHKLPTTRQKKPNRAATPTATRRAKAKDLNEAFSAFTQVAESLEASYHLLSQEAARLRLDLEAKNQENERMRASMACILENLPCAVVAIDADGELRLANPEAHRLLDLTEDTLSILRQIENSEGEHEIAIGDRRLAVTCALRDGFAIFLIREVARTAFLLANEIRNPLSSMDLFAGLLADSVEQHPETRQWVDHLQSGLRQVSSTVHNTLHFQSTPAPRLENTNLTRLLRETVEFLRPVARQKGMRIELAVDGGALTIAAEPLSLQQVFFNLALNAVRAMTPGGILNITAHRDHQGVRVTFADQGCGIAVEDLDRIFEPGFSSHAGSPGLGLAVGRKIVELHGGNIAVNSTAGQGSQFIVSLPVLETAGISRESGGGLRLDGAGLAA